jgi:hypothetical protein
VEAPVEAPGEAARGDLYKGPVGRSCGSRACRKPLREAPVEALGGL